MNDKRSGQDFEAGIETDSVQGDHVRLYSHDISVGYEQTGFRSLVVTHEAVLPEYSPSFYGVNVKEPFFLFESV